MATGPVVHRWGRGIIESLCASKDCQAAEWIGVGIGINTGPVYVGSIGSETFKDYTVVGNTVNVAARICGRATKFQVLFTENRERLIAPGETPYASIGKVALKGLKEPVEVFELIT